MINLSASKGSFLFQIPILLRTEEDQRKGEGDQNQIDPLGLPSTKALNVCFSLVGKALVAELPKLQRGRTHSLNSE